MLSLLVLLFSSASVLVLFCVWHVDHIATAGYPGGQLEKCDNQSINKSTMLVQTLLWAIEWLRELNTTKHGCSRERVRDSFDGLLTYFHELVIAVHISAVLMNFSPCVTYPLPPAPHLAYFLPCTFVM